LIVAGQLPGRLLRTSRAPTRHVACPPPSRHHGTSRLERGPETRARGSTRRGRFAHEIRATAALQHPHILPLFDSGTADGFLFYVMPFIDGETLRNRLNRDTQWGIDEAIRITTDVAQAL
jgi:serine/threonine protein kinase